MDIMELIGDVAEYKPLVAAVIEGLKQYEEEWNEIKNFFLKEHLKGKVNLFNGFLANGFSREEALALTLNVTQDIKNTLNSLKTMKGGK